MVVPLEFPFGEDFLEHIQCFLEAFKRVAELPDVQIGQAHGVECFGDNSMFGFILKGHNLHLFSQDINRFL